MKPYLLLLLACPLLSFASTEEEIHRFHRCYQLFTSEPAALNHPLLVAVKKGKSGTEACMELIEKATLVDQGTKEDSVEARKILGRINELHNSWFIIKDPLSEHSHTSDVHDKSEHAFHLTYTLLGPDQKFKDTITRNYSFRPVRKSSSLQPFAKNARLFTDLYDATDMQFDFTANEQLPRSIRCRPLPGFGDQRPIAEQLPNTWYGFPGYIEKGPIPFRMAENPDTFLTYVQGRHMDHLYFTEDMYQQCMNGVTPLSGFEPEIIQRGVLQGLEVKVPNSKNFVRDMQNGAPNDILQHMGAGAIGTQTYLLGNAGDLGFSEGALHVKRRWGKNVIDDFMCRELPALRTTDVLGDRINPETSEVVSNSKISFRKGVTCMSCHMTMDPMGGAVRDLIGMNTASSIVAMNSLTYIRRHQTSGPISGQYLAKLDADGNYSRRPPEGLIFFRGHNGTLHRKEVLGLQDLGEKLVMIDDYYICGAKKYYKLLTGVDVRLPDAGNLTSVPLNPQEKIHHQKVVSLGLQLKNHQNVKSLIKSIIASPDFLRIEGR